MRRRCVGEITVMQQKITTLKPLLIITSAFAVFGSYSTSAFASLSSQPATPNQINKVVAKAATPAQIRQQMALQQETKAKIKSSRASDRHAALNSASEKVNRIYRKWAGARYRLGGEGRGGIDCSSFVQKTMAGAFNLDLPRSTAEQRHLGRAIAKSELRPGDLVFFRHNNHVGVYVGDGKFVHASSSRGVTKSSLSERYWARNYTQSRRVM